MQTAVLTIWLATGAALVQTIDAGSSEDAMAVCEAVIFGGHWEGEAAICTARPLSEKLTAALLEEHRR